MFGFGILAHSLLFPFIGILVQIFVVNFFLKSPSEPPASSVETQVAVYADGGCRMPNSGSSYAFFDYYEVPATTEVPICVTSAVFDFPLIGGRFVSTSLGSTSFLRAPPVA